MTIDTIKNVLMRILSINKNLSEESLHNLFVASGWDESDIVEGINIYKAYKLRGGDADAVSEYKPVQAVTEAPKIDNVIFKAPEKKVEILQEEKVLKDSVEKDGDIVSLMDTSQSNEGQNEKGENLMVDENANKIEEKKKTEEEKAEEEKEEKDKVPFINLINHESHIDAGEMDQIKNREKPLFLIMLDVALFLIALGLLIYIAIG